MPEPSPYWMGRIAVERNKLEAFQDGYAACEDGLPVGDNPCDPGSQLWGQWDKGWHQAKNDEN